MDDLTEALTLAARLDELAEEQTREVRAEDYPAGSVEAFLRAEFEAPETLLLVAREEGTSAALGLCLVGPGREPLTGESTPLILVLHVEPAQRHQSLAGQLVAAAERHLAQRGQTRLAGRVGAGDDALISIGERRGFIRRWEWVERGLHSA